jgi:hypothetical protein
MPKLISETMHDGSRLFVLLPQSKSSLRLLLHIFSLSGAYPTSFTPSLGETWIDFHYQGDRFTINNQFGDYWFFVANPGCPDAKLQKVADHFAKILN